MLENMKPIECFHCFEHFFQNFKVKWFMDRTRSVFYQFESNLCHMNECLIPADYIHTEYEQYCSSLVLQQNFIYLF